MTATIPATFRSEAALAEAVDAAFAEALAQELAAVLADEPALPARPFGLPTTEALIAQAGIVTGPAPRDPRTPSPAAQHTKAAAVAGGKLAGRAAWWLLKATAYVTAVVVREVLVTAWQLVFGITPQETEQPAPDSSGRGILPSDFLTATSGEIEQRGWAQHTLQDSYGRVCVLGAQRALLKSGTGTARTAREANDHLLAVTNSWSVAWWNDRLTRQEQQVHAALLAAADRARAAGH
jgi:hypothetical protein